MGKRRIKIQSRASTQPDPITPNVLLVARTDRPPIDRGIAMQVAEEQSTSNFTQDFQEKIPNCGKEDFSITVMAEVVEGSEA